MSDQEMLQGLLARDETALRRIYEFYGNYLRRIAGNILESPEDAEELLNDTLMLAWEAIPPAQPGNLRAWLGKVIRNRAINLLRNNQAVKRGGQVLGLITELDECVSGGTGPEEAYQAKELAEALNGFLAALPPLKRRMFLLRYWQAESIDSIAAEMQKRPGAVAMALSRIRKELKEYLKERGFES
ncbi:MAG: RNA polymerase sigma factor [Lachnospiraceae bacterium]|nr:RNA polymerase sigma factor [Lachnospiraceae bacterium]